MSGCAFIRFILLKDGCGRNEWLKFIFNKVYNNFSLTFTVRAGCFVNMSQFNSGFAKRLLLKDCVVRNYTGPEGSLQIMPFQCILLYGLYILHSTIARTPQTVHENCWDSIQECKFYGYVLRQTEKQKINKMLHFKGKNKLPSAALRCYYKESTEMNKPA